MVCMDGRTEGTSGSPTAADDPLCRVRGDALSAKSARSDWIVGYPRLPEAASLLPSGLEATSQRTKAEAASKNDDQNPDPSSWQYDGQGHLLAAGKVFSATYDAAGNPVTVKMRGQTWVQTDQGVTHQMESGSVEKIPGGKLSVAPFKKDAHGLVAGVDVEINFGESGHEGSYSTLYRSPENARFYKE